MKIIITESQYKKLSGEIEEVLGVPEGILETGEELYDLIIEKLENVTDVLRKETKVTFDINKRFVISNHTFDKVTVNFDIVKDSRVKELHFYGMYSEDVSEISDEFRLKSVIDPNHIIIGFKIYLNPKLGIDDIVNELKEKKSKSIPSLSHELKHSFRRVVEKGTSAKSATKYRAVQDLRQELGFIPEINEYLYNSYFIHSVENVVRPTELASEMRINNVSRKDFLKFFMSSEIIERLKKIQNFNYETFKKNLGTGENIKRIKEMFHDSDVDIEGKTDEELVNTTLRMVFVSLVNKKSTIMQRILTSNNFEAVFGFTGDKNEFFKKYVLNARKYGYDYDRFFKDEEKYFHRVSSMMFKKLAKLYALAKENPS